MANKTQPKFCFSLRVEPNVLEAVKRVMKKNRIGSRNEAFSKAMLIVDKENIIISDKIN
jgi:hypothetical protein